MGTAKRERQKQGRQLRIEQEQRAQQQSRRRRLFINGGLILIAFLVLAFVVSRLVGGGDDDGEEVSTETTVAETSETTAAEGTETTVAESADTTVAETSETTVAEGTEPTVATPTGFAYGTGECAPADGSAERRTSFDDAPQQCLDPATAYVAVFDTSAGQIRVQLDTETTPGTANNFANLARFRYYDGTPIFRTDPSIGIIQGGGESPSDPGPGYTIPDEGEGFTYEPGQLVMARTSAPDSAGAQFFFVAGPEASALDGQGTYVVFGTVTEGLDVVQAILASHQDQPDNPLGGAPDPPVTVNSVTIEAA